MKAKEFEKLTGELSSKLQEIVSEIESLRDELQESLDNIPESLQESSPLNERIENLDEWIDGIVVEYPG